MTVFSPSWKLTVNNVDYTDVTIANLGHNAGRKDIYSQPVASYIQCSIVALNDENYNFKINDGLTLQIKDSTNAYVSLFGGNITDIQVQIYNAGSVGKEIRYNIIALGSLAKLTKIITNGVLAQDDDGNQIYELIYPYLLNSWNEVSANETWSGYNPTITWANAEDIGLGEIDRPGVYEMENRTSNPDTVYNIASRIARSAFGYLYEDSQGNISYADTQHRQNYLANNGYTEISANACLAKNLKTVVKAGDIRNDIYINYGNNFGSQKTASSTQSIELYGYKSETIDSYIHDATDAQAVANRYINLRAFPRPLLDSITFPLTNDEIDNVDRDALLSVFMGQPIRITDLPLQIAETGQFEGYVEGWSWSVSYNQLFLTLNLSPIEFSQVAVKWGDVSVSETWNTLSAILTWENAIGAVA